MSVTTTTSPRRASAAPSYQRDRPDELVRVGHGDGEPQVAEPALQRVSGGRLSRGLDQLEQSLGPAGFVRVSRTTLVNVDCVREIVPAFKGAVWIVVDGVDSHVVVSRRRVAALRSALGI